MEQENIKTRYSDNELLEFRALQNDKIGMAREELLSLAGSLSFSNANGTDNTSSSGKTLEDGSATLEKSLLTNLPRVKRNL